MDFSVSPKIHQDLKLMRSFVKEELYPIESKRLHESWPTLESTLQPLRDTVKSNGWWAPYFHGNKQGKSYSLVELGLISEVMGASPLGHYVFGSQAPDAGNAELLEAFGSEEQKEQYLKPLVDGKIRSCFAMTEPAVAGSNPTLLEATAEKDGDDYIINAHKWFTSSADGANFAIIMAVTNPEADIYQRSSMLIVDCDNPGFELVRNISIMGEQGAGYFSHAETKFTNCRVPKTALIGAEGEGFKLAQTRLGPGRIHHCMRWLGIADRALKMHCDYAKTRMIGHKRSLADSDITKQRIAENAANIAAAKALVLQTAWQIEHQGFKAARFNISMIKYFTANVLQKSLDDAIQAMGGLGMTDDTILAYFFRHERAARIYDGPDEVHQVSVAKQLLK
ncbi:acyl-CoA dehydrogenase family protein [Kangiella sp. HZ709]|uniref:acyl-CoA dehydrogenase family protein n=1 Tax=Kangiella sp. HZ709 TaxID=2666328 RepID=UPI0012AFFD36|nr:acyl-CoA dehydrogenase family protein [Kangiella sp. HZ709]MRX27249.1 acyl-CoA dehydrogenase [Kangiella sp. HZ709]